MNAKPPPREAIERVEWFLDPKNYPSKPGMCAQHTWHSLGGDYDNPPRWYAENANVCIDKIIASGRYWTPKTWSGPPPYGAWVGWKYKGNGHAALSLGDGSIATTDPSNGKPTGIEACLDYPKKWGYDPSAGLYTLWTDEYNAVRFPVGKEKEEDMALSDEDIDKIVAKVWAKKIPDTTNGDEPSASTMLGRAVTLGRQSRDAARLAVAQTAPENEEPSTFNEF